MCYNRDMETQYLLQKLNANRYRRFIANTLGEHGGTTSVLRSAKTWEKQSEAERFRLIHNLTEFDVVLSDGTDDYQTECQEHWARKEARK
jgi:hypothetical protein